MKKILAIALALCMVFSVCAVSAFADDEITLDVIICQYGPNTQEWFLGKGMNGTNFVDKFEAENQTLLTSLKPRTRASSSTSKLFPGTMCTLLSILVLLQARHRTS